MFLGWDARAPVPQSLHDLLYQEAPLWRGVHLGGSDSRGPQILGVLLE